MGVFWKPEYLQMELSLSFIPDQCYFYAIFSDEGEVPMNCTGLTLWIDIKDSGYRDAGEVVDTLWSPAIHSNLVGWFSKRIDSLVRRGDTLYLAQMST